MSTTIAWVRNPPDNLTQGETWNVTTGCSRVSAGCKGCYAERLAGTRLSRLPAYVGLTRPTPDGPRWTGEVRFDATKLAVPLRRRKPTGYFVNDMSDLFHERVTDEQIASVFGVMAACPQHRFYLCSKRAERMEEWFRWVGFDQCHGAAHRRLGAQVFEHLPRRWPLPNVWLLVSAEDQATADERIPHLLRCPAAVRGLSMEPLLEEVNVSDIVANEPGRPILKPLVGVRWAPRPGDWVRTIPIARLHWVIVGAESGPRARPCDVEWIRSIRDQCQAAGGPLFVKQLHLPQTLFGVPNGEWRLSHDPSEWPPGEDWPREWPMPGERHERYYTFRRIKP